MLRNVICLITLMILLVTGASAQVTSASIGGFIKSSTGEALAGATITATHVPTGSVYKTQSGKSGTYNIDNMTPGGPYTVEVSYVGLGTEKKTGIYLNLGETYKNDVSIAPVARELAEVVVTAGTSKTDIGKGGTNTTLSREKLETMPTVGRNLSDYLRATPQIKLASSSNTSSENAMSIAGQNVRFNSFYIDGAVNNDVYGLAYSGTNGGQSSISPLSIDAIDQIQVMIAPYDASIGNFTGGAINAITKSGTNEVHGSAYYLFRNQDLAGRTPTGLNSLSTKYTPFTNKTYGATIGGPIIKNKLFYFISAEFQRDETPNPFDISTYKGDIRSTTGLDNLKSYITSKTDGYDPGSYTNSQGELKSDKIAVKVDWNINDKHKLTASYRYTGGDKLVVFSSSATQLNFSNNGYRFPTKTNSASLELKSKTSSRSSNRLLLTITDVEDNRGPLSGQQAPNVTITNGAGTIKFGTEANSTFNYLKQSTYNLSDQFRYTYGKNTFSAGFEAEYYKVINSFISNNTGTYQYDNVPAFLNDLKPRSYVYNFPLIGSQDEKSSDASAKFNVFRGAFFLNNEIKVTPDLTINAGVRADYYNFPTTPIADRFAIDSALPKIKQYYDLEGAVPGQAPNVPVAISPRLGFTYKVNKLGIVLRGGAGMNTGRIPLVWPGGIYNQTGRSSGGYTINSSNNTAIWNQDKIRYRTTPYSYSDLGINLDNAKNELDLITKKFKTPKVFRTSLAIDKNINGWLFTVEGVYTKNINDLAITNVNIIPPQSTSVGPDNRKVYGTATSTSIAIPIRSNGLNPYTSVFLLSNQKGDKGYSYNLTFQVTKTTRTGFNLQASYNYGQSYIVNDNQSSTNLSQWNSNESVNGRNYLTRSISDNSAAHRIFAFVSKKFTYSEGHLATTIGFTYNGQSGLPFSYVYNGQAVRDGLVNPYDLIYIPTATELQNQTFKSLTPSGSTTTYTVEQQKAALEKYIQNDDYLSSHRGKFAERNASRTLFTNVVDMRLAQDFSVKAGRNRYTFQVIYSMFNFTNFINRDWGHQYQTGFDQFTLQAVSYATATGLTPIYTFNPMTVTPGNVTTTVNPTYSSRWTSQLELRFKF